MSREIEVPGESYEAALVRERVARRQAEAALAACRERWRATEAQVEAFRTALVEAETEAKYHYTSESLNFNNLDGRLTAIVVPIGKWDALAALSRVSRSEPAPPNEALALLNELCLDSLEVPLDHVDALDDDELARSDVSAKFKRLRDLIAAPPVPEEQQ